MKVALVVLALAAIVNADMYLHNPRGANNRLDEARRDRNNANRLYDSQNNNRGGYNVGSLYYYTGSTLSVEWTNQHSCGDQNNHCEQILQYMCEDRVRDGATTNTIPENPAQCDNFDCNTDLEYGMHEPFDYYLDCRLRQRNTGLFIADRNLRGRRNTAIFTRQNEQGTRRGYECPEERDYYPYWHPTPWRDIVVFTNNASRCSYYQTESANVKSRFACVLPEGYINENSNRGRGTAVIPNEQEACEEIMYDDGSPNGTYGEWREFSPDSRLSAPECIESQWSRDNHLGNTRGGYPMYYNWTIPNIPHQHCVLRIRYNISTGDYDAWDGATNSSLERRTNVRVFNGDTNDFVREEVSELDVYSQYGFSMEQALERGYVFRQNPVVKIFDDIDPDPNVARNFGLQLAINTNQFGRTFQDRSHTFAIRERPEELQGATIYNLNVRGKRGNIVQVYPGVEYDFVPNVLVASVNSYVHVQWTGSNTNPNNNDGQGRAGTDRSNMVLLGMMNFDEGNGMAVANSAKNGHWGNSHPAHLGDNETFLGWSREDRQTVAVLDNVQLGGEMSELDDAGTYFDLGPRKVTKTGTYYYMCTRNNNFTNRSQKGKVIVQDNAVMFSRVGSAGGTVQLSGHSLEFGQGDLDDAVEFRLEQYADSGAALQAVQSVAVPPDGEFQTPPNVVSPYVLVNPVTNFAAAQRTATIVIDIDDSASTDTQIYRANPSSDWNFVSMSTEVQDGRAIAQTDQGGVFVAASGLNTIAIAVGVSVAVVLLVVVLCGSAIMVYFVVRPEKWRKTTDTVRKTKTKVTRSFAKQV